MCAPPLPEITTVYLALVESCGIGQASPARAAEPAGAPAARTTAVYAVVGSWKNSDDWPYGMLVVLGAAGADAAEAPVAVR